MAASISYYTKRFLFTTFFLVALGFSDPEREIRVAVASESNVVISGTTNINKFSCSYNLQRLELPIRMVYNEKVDRILFENAKLKLENDCFDCGGKIINKDFRQLLKSDQYPQVELQLLFVEPPKPDTQKIEVGMEIRIAGVTQRYQVYLQCEDQEDICVNGTLKVRLSHFGLEPPQKALGMIKVHDEINVHVTLQLSEV